MKGFASWLSSKMAILLFGVALFAAMMQLYAVAHEYHERILASSDALMIKNSMLLLPAEGQQNITLSRGRNVILTSECVLSVDGLNTSVPGEQCQESQKNSDRVTVRKTGGVARID